jgi:heme/copper-type cytochrome/quinol oxidase subunit 3
MTDLALPLPTESRRARVDATFGMALFIGSWSMAFATLFLTFLVLRHRQPVWPPEGVLLPSLPLAGLATAALLASSALLHAAVARLRAGRPGFGPRWVAGLAAGLVFAALQSWLWIDVWSAGGRPDTDMYQGLFYMLTWFHALHVACGLIALAVIAGGAATGRITAARATPASSVAIFWHFVDAVWLVLFFSFFAL